MMQLCIANDLRIGFQDPPKGFRKFLKAHIPDLLVEMDEPTDVTIRFVNHIPFRDQLRVAPFATFDGTRFCFRDKYGKRAIIPFHKLSTGEPIEIVAEKGIIASNFYEIIIRLIIRHKLLQKQIVFIHASGIVLNGSGVIFPAWGGTGKTNTVINFLQDGAQYLGDDLILASADGNLFPFPEQISMFDYNFAAFPDLRKTLSYKKLGLFTFKKSVETIDNILSNVLSQASTIKAVSNRLTLLSKSLVSTPMSHSKLSTAGVPKTSTPLSRIIFLSKGDVVRPITNKINAETMAYKMAACLEFEHLFHTRIIDAFGFADPQSHELNFSDTFQQEKKILTKVFSGKQITHITLPLQMDNKKMYMFVKTLT